MSTHFLELGNIDINAPPTNRKVWISWNLVEEKHLPSLYVVLRSGKIFSKSISGFNKAYTIKSYENFRRIIKINQ